MNTISSSLAQISLLSLSHGSILSLLASSHSVSFQKHRFTYGIALVLVFLLPLLTLLLPLFHPKSLISLLPSLLSSFSPSLVFSFFSSSVSFLLVSFYLSPFVSAILTSTTLIFTVFHTPLDTLLSLSLLSSSQS